MQRTVRYRHHSAWRTFDEKTKENQTLYPYIPHEETGAAASALKIVILVLVLAALVFVGYSVAAVMDFFSGNMKPSVSSESLDDSASDLSSSSESSSSSSEPDCRKTLVAVTVPSATLRDTAAFEGFLQQAKQQGATAVLIELKNEDGILQYRSSVPQAATYGAVAADAVDLAPLMQIAQQQDIAVIAKLNAFKDKTAPNASRDNGYLYEAPPRPGGIILQKTEENLGLTHISKRPVTI